MDLSTATKKLLMLEYATVYDVHADISLMFSNCYQYNVPNSDIVTTAKHLETK